MGPRNLHDHCCDQSAPLKKLDRIISRICGWSEHDFLPSFTLLSMNSRCGSETRTRSLGDAAIVSCVDGGVLIYLAVLRRRWLDMFALWLCSSVSFMLPTAAGIVTIHCIPDARSAIYAGCREDRGKSSSSPLQHPRQLQFHHLLRRRRSYTSTYRQVKLVNYVVIRE
jgi:hypothetical protein